jgi:hypothetical protein
MTVDLIGDESAYHIRRAKLGQDPLREDADPDALWWGPCTSTNAV